MSTGGVLKYIILVNNKFFCKFIYFPFWNDGCLLYKYCYWWSSQWSCIYPEENFLCIIFIEFDIWIKDKPLIALTSQFAFKNGSIMNISCSSTLNFQSKSHTFLNMAEKKIGYCMNFWDEELCQNTWKFHSFIIWIFLWLIKS